MPDVNLIALPMLEALAFWRDKVPMRREDFDELVEQIQARAFYVSGLTKIDQIGQAQHAIDAALAKGETFEDFKARIPDIIKQEGWSGVRLEIIYRTNVQTAYMAGLYTQLMEVVQARPYWRYSAVNDSRTRPAHRAMHGRVFPADSPVWDKWYPPNGYRCRCGVETLSAREVERDGLTVETDDPTGEMYEPIDPDTGEKLPARSLMPDNGFLRNVGKEWLDAVPRPYLDATVEEMKLPELIEALRQSYRKALRI